MTAFAAARVSLKQHRFEVGAAVIAAIASGSIGLSMALQIDALGVSKDCLDRVQASQDGFSAGQECFALVREGTGIIGETFLTGQGTVALSVMGVLPFLVGLLGGVPIVARELEDGTAQTAWTLCGSRGRWLRHKIGPIALVLGVAMIFAALAAAPAADASVAWGQSGFSLIGLHGPSAVVRAFGAFGIGLMLGALLGRAYIAFIVGIAVSSVLLLAVGTARDAWTASLDPVPIAGPTSETGEYSVMPRALTTEWGVMTPDGVLLSSADGRRIATKAGVPPAPADDVQDIPALTWYEENGYGLVQMGVSDEIALGWAPYDGLIFGAVGALSIGASIVLVNRRRPI